MSEKDTGQNKEKLILLLINVLPVMPVQQVQLVSMVNLVHLASTLTMVTKKLGVKTVQTANIAYKLKELIVL